MCPEPSASMTTPASPKMVPWISPRFSAAICASRPPTPTMRTSFSGAQPIFLARMRANTQVVEPTTVQPMVALEVFQALDLGHHGEGEVVLLHDGRQRPDRRAALPEDQR